MVAQLENHLGDRAYIDFDERGFVFIVNKSRSDGKHAAPSPTLVHYASTYDVALDGLRQLTGTDWRRV